MNKIQSLLKKSNLNIAEQTELDNVLNLLPVTELNKLCDFLESHPEWVEKLYKNYKQKKIAASSKDLRKWQDIFNQEKEELKKI